MNGVEDDKEVSRQLRDLNLYTKPVDKKEKKEIVITSIEDVVEMRPSTKKLRKYYQEVLTNISNRSYEEEIFD